MNGSKILQIRAYAYQPISMVDYRHERVRLQSRFCLQSQLSCWRMMHARGRENTIQDYLKQEIGEEKLGENCCWYSFQSFRGEVMVAHALPLPTPLSNRHSPPPTCTRPPLYVNALSLHIKPCSLYAGRGSCNSHNSINTLVQYSSQTLQ